MARQGLTPKVIPTKYAQSFGTIFNWNASDNVNGSAVRINGRMLVIAWNNTATNQTLTVRASADPFNRTQDIAKVVPPQGWAITQMFPTTGWVQPSDQMLWIDTSNTELRVLIVEVPPT